MCVKTIPASDASKGVQLLCRRPAGGSVRYIAGADDWIGCSNGAIVEQRFGCSTAVIHEARMLQANSAEVVWGFCGSRL